MKLVEAAIIDKKQKPASGILRVLKTAGGFHLLLFALIANIGEGIGKTLIASYGGKMLDAAISLDEQVMGSGFKGILIAIALMALCIFTKDSLLGSYLEQGMVRLRTKTISAIGKAKMIWLDGRHSGELSARVMADLNALGSALRPVLIMGISLVIYASVFVVFLFMMDWLLTLIIFAIVPVTTTLQWLSSKPIKKYRKANQEAIGSLSSVIFDCFGSFETVKSLSIESEMANRFQAAQEKQLDAAVNEVRISSLLQLISGIGRYLPQFILIVVGGLFVINQRLTIGQMTIFLSLSSSVISVLGGIGSLLASIRQLSANAERISEIWDTPQEPTDGVTDMPADMTGALVFDTVSFQYKEGDIPSLTDITFRVTKGAFVALVGESGCGKSTVMKLAASLYTPDMGCIKTYGRDDTTWNLDVLRSHIAYVAQDTYLFPGTLRENIQNGYEVVSPEKVDTCARLAQLSELIASLPDGLDTQVGERGVFLSGGQRQRISIARALCKDADLLFLDEATSALDQTTEEAILNNILQMPYHPTVLFITHRLQNARNADRIIVLNNGRICEAGTHEELLRLQGKYAQLIENQKEDAVF